MTYPGYAKKLRFSIKLYQILIFDQKFRIFKILRFANEFHFFTFSDFPGYAILQRWCQGRCHSGIIEEQDSGRKTSKSWIVKSDCQNGIDAVF